MTKSVLLIISGSIAAYKSLEIIRRLRELGIGITTILTQGGAEFVTPLSIAALSGGAVYSELFSLKDESEMGHIRLSRESDVIAVMPASSNIIAKMANGLADDLASTTLLATDKPVLIAPAMNAKMWEHPATKRNIKQLKQDGIAIIEPESGELACGEVGTGRLAEIETLVQAIVNALNPAKPLQGYTALVTSGATQEPIDPVRFITNRSSGKQGIAIANALHKAGAEVTLVTGATTEIIPEYVQVIKAETAEAMLAACEANLPKDIFIACAAVSDWKIDHIAQHKLKKRSNEDHLALKLVKNPDILHSVSTHPNRPALVIGFAAETQNLETNAKAKLESKGCDWIIANDVSDNKVFSQDHTNSFFMSKTQSEDWGNLSKTALAEKLVTKIGETL